MGRGGVADPQLFLRFNVHGRGEINGLEIVVLLRSLGVRPARGRDLHGDGNGTVEFDELALSSAASPLTLPLLCLLGHSHRSPRPSTYLTQTRTDTCQLSNSCAPCCLIKWLEGMVYAHKDKLVHPDKNPTNLNEAWKFQG